MMFDASSVLRKTPPNSRTPVDVAIATGTRTTLDYFLAPVLDVMEKGMRER